MVSGVVSLRYSAVRPRSLRLDGALSILLIGALTACAESSRTEDPDSVQASGGEGGGGSLGVCGDATDELLSGSGTPVEPLAPLFETPIPESDCGAVEREFEPALAPGPTHVTACSEIDYVTNPPCLGPHYGSWAAFQNYDAAIPRGFWVHSLEHGAVVISYACEDCEDEVAAAKAMIAELPIDPLCSAPVERRVILTPDRRLDTRWAASAWGFTLTSDCFEPEVFSAFAVSHNAAGPEDFCANGVDVSRPSNP